MSWIRHGSTISGPKGVPLTAAHAARLDREMRCRSGVFVFLLGVSNFAFATDATPRETRFRDVSMPSQSGDRLEIRGLRGSVVVRAAVTGASEITVRGKKIEAAGVDSGVSFRLRREGNAIALEPASTAATNKLNLIELARPGGPEFQFEVASPPMPLEIAWRQGSVRLEKWPADASIFLVDGDAQTSDTRGSLRMQISRGRGSIERHQGPIDAQAASAALIIDSAASSARVDSVAGAVDARGLRGALLARVGSGPITVNGGEGSLDIDATNGPVSIASWDGNARVRDDHAPISISFAAQPDAYLDSGDGAITVKLKPDWSAAVSARSDGGRVIAPEPLKVIKQERGSESMTGRIPGLGAGQLTLTSKSGVIRIR